MNVDHSRVPLTFLQALLLGLVQGLTEFFPISSSAHLKIAKSLMGLPLGEDLVLFDLICHSGTMLALVLYLRKEIMAILADRHQIALYGLALAPLVPAYFLLKPLREALSDPSYLGIFLAITGALLFAAAKKRVALSSPQGHFEGDFPQKTFPVLCIGMMQAIALIPGLSRSGSTIAAGRFCGWSWIKAAKFSFLLAIPAVLGGLLLEIVKWTKSDGGADCSLSCYAVGFGMAFLIGMGAVRFVFWIYEREKVRPLAWYCLGLAFVAWALFHGKAAS